MEVDVPMFNTKVNLTDVVKTLGGLAKKRVYGPPPKGPRKKKRGVSTRPALQLRNADSITTTLKKKKKRKVTRKKKSLKARVSRLEKGAPKHSVFFHRDSEYLFMNGTINQKRWYDISGFSHKHIEDTLGNIRVDGTDLDLLTEAKTNDVTVACRNIYQSILLKNNFTTNCSVRVYWVQATDDSNIQLNTIIQKGFQDAGYTNVHTTASTARVNGSTSIRPAFASSGLNNVAGNGLTNIFLSESKQFMRTFKIVKSDKLEMGPGDSAKSFYTMKSYNYKPRETDNEAEVFKERDIHCIVELVGSLGHGASPSTFNIVGWMASRLDAVVDIKYDVVYDGAGEYRKHVNADIYDTTDAIVYVEGSPSVPDIVTPDEE